MNLLLHPCQLSGKIAAIPSKSAAHRLLICAALAQGETTLILKSDPSKDILATMHCLNAMGADITMEGHTIFVKPIDRSLDTPYTIHCEESGSTLRFLLPVAAALGRPFTVTGSGRLPQRPIDTLTDLLKANGCTVEGEMLPLQVNGKLTAANFAIPGNISSQYITGLLLTLPLLQGGQITLTTELESAPYVALTVGALEHFGCTVLQGENTFRVTGSLSSPGTLQVEGDWSNAAFWLAAGALGEGVTVTDLDLNSKQGDKAIVDILEKMGADLTRGEDWVSVKKSALHSIAVDAREIPDLVPIVSVLLSLADGTGRIENAARLRLKESDRLETVTATLNAIGAQITEFPDALEIRGVPHFTAGETKSYNDHRIAMSLAVAASAGTGDIFLEQAQAVEKSYPAFWDAYQTMGGKADVLSTR